MYELSAKSVGFAPPLSHLRAVCNHWCTFSRFGNKKHGCLFGCGSDTDRVSHTICCPKFWVIFCGVCDINSISPSLENIFLLNGPCFGYSFDCSVFAILASHVCFLCFNACRHGLPFNRRLVLHKLYSFTRTHCNAAKFLRHLKIRNRSLIFAQR